MPEEEVTMKMKLSLLFTSLIASGHAFAGGHGNLYPIAKAIGVNEAVVTYAFVGIILVLFGLVYQTKVAKASDVVVPDEGITFRNIMETFGEFIYGQCRSVIGEHEAPKYFSFIGFVFLFILLNNLLGLIPNFMPATSNINTTLGLGIVSFVYYNVMGCKEQGTINYLKHFAGPLWYMAVLIFPIEILSNFVRPLSLGLRLQGNMTGDHKVLEVFSELVPLGVPIACLLLGTLVSLIQAFVFTVLTMVYISMATAHHDHDEEAAH